MRLWPWRRYANPGSGRDEFGRLVDGDRVPPPIRQPAGDPASGLDGHTMLLPIITPAAQLRGQGGGWRR